MLTEAEMVKLLGRSLTTLETTNFTLYLDIATQRLSELLCMDFSTTAGERTFETRLDYRTAYIDPFTAITSVEKDGETVDSDTYTIKQFDKFNGTWYNIIEFDDKQTGENIAVTATWGIGTLPSDLQLLLAKLFAQNSIEQTADNQVKSKKIEDFTVTFKDGTTYDELVLNNASVIYKYSQCNQGYIRHGRVYPLYHY